MCCAPFSVAFSAFQTSSRSAYCRSSSADRFLQRFGAFARRFVLLLLQRFELHLELDQTPFEFVHLFGLRVHFHSDAARGFVDEIDRFVRKLATRDVAMRQTCRRHDRRVGNVDRVVKFVALFQAAQDRDRVFDAGLVDEDLLETPLERRVLFDVLAVFVERGGADAMQFAARKRRFEHVAGIHRAFGFAGADHRVQLVDEQDDVAFLFREFVQHGLQAFFEFAAEFRTRDQRAHVECENPFALQAFRYLAVEDPLRKTFDDRGLAHARLADQHRIVLGASLQHLNRAANFVVATNDRIELALFGAFGEIDRVLVERLTTLFRVLILHGFSLSNVCNDLFQRIALDRRFAQQASDSARIFRSSEQAPSRWR